MKIINIFKDKYGLDNDELLAIFSEKITEVEFKKGELIVNEKELCPALYFIEKGLVRVFFEENKRVNTMQFYAENKFVTVANSFVNKSPSEYKIEALENTVLSVILYQDLLDLSNQYPEVQRVLREIAVQATIDWQNRVSMLLKYNAKERYHHFVKNNLSLLKRISLGDLASFLGMTQVSLSRVRKNYK